MSRARLDPTQAYGSYSRHILFMKGITSVHMIYFVSSLMPPLVRGGWLCNVVNSMLVCSVFCIQASSRKACSHAQCVLRACGTGLSCSALPKTNVSSCSMSCVSSHVMHHRLLVRKNKEPSVLFWFGFGHKNMMMWINEGGRSLHCSVCGLVFD